MMALMNTSRENDRNKKNLPHILKAVFFAGNFEGPNLKHKRKTRRTMTSLFSQETTVPS